MKIMKTSKSILFLLIIFLLSSCNALTDLASKTFDIDAPAIDFSIGGPAAAPQQQIKSNTLTDYVWYQDSVEIKSKLETELAKNSLTIKNVKTLLITSSTINILNNITTNYNLGTITILINGVIIATGSGTNITPTSKSILFTYEKPYSIVEMLPKGKVQLKIVSDVPKPTIKFDMELLNKYSSKVSLL
jgi:archaellum component FlaF (FlaF/FlaG flagellin family)